MTHTSERGRERFRHGGCHALTARQAGVFLTFAPKSHDRYSASSTADDVRSNNAMSHTTAKDSHSICNETQSSIDEGAGCEQQAGRSCCATSEVDDGRSRRKRPPVENGAGRGSSLCLPSLHNNPLRVSAPRKLNLVASSSPLSRSCLESHRHIALMPPQSRVLVPLFSVLHQEGGKHVEHRHR